MAQEMATIPITPEAKTSPVVPDENHWAAKVKPPTDSLTAWQWFYVIFLQGILTSAVCFGANFGIGILVFRNQPRATLWFFPLPIAGNFGVIIIVEVLLNFCLSGSMQTLDIVNGIVAPLKPEALGLFWRKVLRPQPDSSLFGWFTSSDIILPPAGSTDTLCQRLGAHAKRSLPWILGTFVLVWPIICAVSAAFWGNDGYNDYPLPEYLSAVEGAVVAMITCPFWALISMTAVAERLQLENVQIKSEMELTQPAQTSPA